jgi:hypothetical protein
LGDHRFQTHIEDIVKEASQEQMQEIRAAVQRAVEKTLQTRNFDGTIAGAVQASIKVSGNECASNISAGMLYL